MKRDFDDFTARERRALSAWRVPEPPPELVSRVMAGLEVARGSGGSARPMALAALALALVGSFFGVRLLASTAGAGSQLENIGNVHPADGGSAVEAQPVSDVRS